MVDLLEDAAGDAAGIEAEDAERAETEMTDGRISDEAFPVALAEADPATVDNSDE